MASRRKKPKTVPRKKTSDETVNLKSETNLNNGQLQTIDSIALMDVLMFTVTPSQQVVAIKVFPAEYNEHECEASYDDFLAMHVSKAIDLKRSVELGIVNVKEHVSIIEHPNWNSHMLQFELEVHKYENVLKLQNHLQKLNYSFVQSLSLTTPKPEAAISALLEFNELLDANSIKPLLLRKYPELVTDSLQLCNYVGNSKQKQHVFNTFEGHSEQIRILAFTAVDKIKIIMKFNGDNEQFSKWFNDDIKVFNELTVDLSLEERRKLSEDPIEKQQRQAYDF